MFHPNPTVYANPQRYSIPSEKRNFKARAPQPTLKEHHTSGLAALFIECLRFNCLVHSADIKQFSNHGLIKQIKAYYLILGFPPFEIEYQGNDYS